MPPRHPCTPSPSNRSASNFLKLSRQEEAELYRTIRIYWREAKRCEAAGAHFSCCVMLGSLLEGMLMLMVNAYPEEAKATGKIPQRGGRPMNLIGWNLTQLLQVADATAWLPSGEHSHPSSRHRKRQIGDYAKIVRDVRNLVHPGRYVTDHARKRVTKRYSLHLFEVVEICKDWLLAHNNVVLRVDLLQEGLL